MGGNTHMLGCECIKCKVPRKELGDLEEIGKYMDFLEKEKVMIEKLKKKKK